MAVLDGDTGTTNADAERLVSAPFVHLVPALTVDALAATRLLLARLAHERIPYQVTRRADAIPDGSTYVAIGTPQSDADLVLTPGAATAQAVELLSALDVHGAPEWAAVGTTFESTAPDDERPGVMGVPSADDPAALAGSTLLHGPFSGDATAAERLLAAGTGRDVATAVALETLRTAPATPSLAAAVTTFLGARPTPDGPFATTAGTADVLDVLVDIDPGLALALACGHDAVADRALTLWHEHAPAVHDAVERADNAIQLDDEVAPVGAAARLIRSVRAPDEHVVVRSRTRLAVASPDPGDTGLVDVFADLDRPVVDHGDGRVTIADWPADESPAAFLPGGDV